MIIKQHLLRKRGRELLGYCQTAFPQDIIKQFQSYWEAGMRAFENSVQTAKNTLARHTFVAQLNEIPIVTCWITGQGSDVADTLYESGDEIIVMLQLFPQNVGISLRTKRDDVNVAEIAKAFAGGGHPKAAGGKLSCGDLMGGYEMIVQKIAACIQDEGTELDLSITLPFEGVGSY